MANSGSDNEIREYLKFNKMITPIFIQALFWVLCALVVIVGLISIIAGIFADSGGAAMVVAGLMMILVGPIMVRIYCELLIVMFRINSHLDEIRTNTRDKSLV